MKSLQLEIPDWNDLNLVLHGREDLPCQQDLAWLCLAAQAAREVWNRTDDRLFQSLLEANTAQGRVSSGDSDAEAQIMPMLPPALSQGMDALPHVERHLHCAPSMILLRERVVEQHEHTIPDKALQGSLELQHDLSNRVVILPQNGNHLFRLSRLGKTRKATQVPEHDRDVAPVTLRPICSTCSATRRSRSWFQAASSWA